VSINAGFHLTEGVTAGQESTEREGLSVDDLKKETSPGITILSPLIVSGLGFAQEEQNADIPNTPTPGALNILHIQLPFLSELALQEVFHTKRTKRPVFYC
jgi:hypothetical protein